MTMKWIFQKMVWFFFLHLREFFSFSLLVQGSEAQGHFWQDACCWWICEVRFTHRCRDWKRQHKVNRRVSLTAHQPLGKNPKILLIKGILRLLLIRSQSEMIIINNFRLYSATLKVTKNVSWQAGSMINETGQTPWHYTQTSPMHTGIAELWLTNNLVQKFKTRIETYISTCASG